MLPLNLLIILLLLLLLMSFLSGVGRVAGAALGSAGGAIGNLIGGKAGSAVGSALSGIGSSAESAASMRQQYEYQKNLQQLSHQYSLETLNKQQNFAAAQSEIDRNWNSASSQASRLREAGINPFFALSGSAPSMVQSQGAGSVSSVSAPNAPFGSSVGSQLGMQSMLNIAQQDQLNRDSSLKQSVEQLNRTDALTRYARNSADIILSMKKAGLISAEEAKTKAETAIENLNRDYYESIAGKRVESFNLDVELKQLDKAFADFNVKHLDERFKLEVAQTNASILQLLASAENLKASALTQPALRYHLIAMGQQIGQELRRQSMTPEQQKRFAESMVKNLEEQARQHGVEADTGFWKALGGIVVGAVTGLGLGRFLGPASKVVKGFKP